MAEMPAVEVLKVTEVSRAEYLRLKCIEHAVIMHASEGSPYTEAVLRTAKEFMEYVTKGDS